MVDSRRTTCGRGRYGSISLRHRHRAGAGAAAAVWLGERLVQVEVDDVEPHVARAADPHDRVEVRPVVVERGADAVDDPLDLLDPGLEQPERRGVGEHQARDVVARLGAQVVEIDVAARIAADLDHLVAGHRHRRGVRPVCRVGGEHLGPVLAPVLVERAREQHAGELALRPGARLERDVGQPGDLAERVLQAPHQLERPLRVARVLERVQARVARQAPRPARGAWGCASSCTSRAGRSRCRDRNSASTGGCSGERSRARGPRAGAAGRRAVGLAAGARRAGARERRAPAGRTRGGPAWSARRSSACRRLARSCSRLHGLPLRRHGRAERISEPIDVRPRPAFGDRDQQPVRVLGVVARRADSRG